MVCAVDIGVKNDFMWQPLLLSAGIIPALILLAAVSLVIGTL